jgi:GNAT superfamily N-acetyltransferase
MSALDSVAQFRRIGVVAITSKALTRCWSNRTAIVVARSTEHNRLATAQIPLAFEIAPSEQLDDTELRLDRLRGADLLYVNGLLHLYRQSPGDLIAARTPDGKLVAVGLMSYSDRFTLLERAAPALHHSIAPDECWTEAHFVLPEFRKQNILGAMLAAEREHLAKRGVRRALATIDMQNGPSLRAFGREGYKPTGTVRRDTRRLNRFSASFGQMDESIAAKWREMTGSTVT